MTRSIAALAPTPPGPTAYRPLELRGSFSFSFLAASMLATSMFAAGCSGSAELELGDYTLIEPATDDDDTLGALPADDSLGSPDAEGARGEIVRGETTGPEPTGSGSSDAPMGRVALIFDPALEGSVIDRTSQVCAGADGSIALADAGSKRVFKVDTTGRELWMADFGEHVVCQDTGEVLVAGSFEEHLDANGISLTGGVDQGYVARLDASGVGLHAWTLSHAVDQLELTQEGVVIRDASRILHYSDAGELLSETDAGVAGAIAVDPDGNYLLATGFSGSVWVGTTRFDSAGGEDVLIAKLSPTGELLWAERYGDDQDQYAERVTSDGAGNVIVAGQFTGAIDFGIGEHTYIRNSPEARETQGFVAKLSATGTAIWSHEDAGFERFFDLKAQQEGDIAFTGRDHGEIKPYTYLSVVVLDAAGNEKWSRRATDLDGALQGALGAGHSLSFDPAGNLVWSLTSSAKHLPVFSDRLWLFKLDR